MSHPARAEPFPDCSGAGPAVLTWDDLDVVHAALAEMAPRWTAELNQTGPDETTIVVMPEGANDLIGPTFILHRDRGRVQLDQFRWDEYRKLGGFRSLDEALSAMRVRLTPPVSDVVRSLESGEGSTGEGGMK
jgi:hypothetical protein